MTFHSQTPHPTGDTDSLRTVLIIDDEPDAIALAEHVLAKAKIPNPTLSFRDGREAIEYLRKCTRGENELPLFAFLDLNMPGVDGFQILDWMRHQPSLRRIIVVIISSSSAERDVAKAFELGAAAYLPKFPSIAEIRSILQLANAMLSVEDLEKVFWPGIRPRMAEVGSESL